MVLNQEFPMPKLDTIKQNIIISSIQIILLVSIKDKLIFRQLMLHVY